MKSYACAFAFAAQLAAFCFLIWTDHPWWALVVLIFISFSPCDCPKKEAAHAD